MDRTATSPLKPNDADFTEQGLRRFKYYPEYKDSGVEWLGKIPTHWKVMTLKRIGGFQAGAGFPETEQGNEVEDLPFYKVGNMAAEGNEIHMRSSPNTVSYETARRLRAFVFPPHTIIFAKVGAALLLNRRRLLTRPSCIDNNMMGFMPKNCEIKWVFYWLSGLDLGELANPGAVPSVNEEQMRDIPVVLPSNQEQKAIALFLYRETSKIDALISKRERLIELLQEKRTALISQAVTKGLDSSVPLKDSGVEWLGEIPAHWEVKRLKYLADSINQKAEQGDSELQYVGLENIESFTGRWVDSTAEITGEGMANIFTTEDVLFGKLRPYLAKTFLPNFQGRCTSELLVLRPSGLCKKFLFYLILSDGFLKQVDASTYGTKMPRANWEFIGGLASQEPPIPEQVAITTFLDRETGKIDTLIKKVRQAIHILKEYRIALISAAVTGKIDVRGERP
jgi:type I restriction enzyme S subunit